MKVKIIEEQYSVLVNNNKCIIKKKYWAKKQWKLLWMFPIWVDVEELIDNGLSVGLDDGVSSRKVVFDTEQELIEFLTCTFYTPVLKEKIINI